MPVIEIEIEIDAPVERVFDLARCIDLLIKKIAESEDWRRFPV